MNLSYAELEEKFTDKSIAAAGREYYRVLLTILTSMTDPLILTGASRGLITDFIFLSRLLGIGYQSGDKIYIPIFMFKHHIIFYIYGWATDNNLEMSIKEFDSLSMQKVDIEYIKNILAFTQIEPARLGIFDYEYKRYINNFESRVELNQVLNTSYMIRFICMLVLRGKVTFSEDKDTLAVDLSDLSDKVIETIKNDSYIHEHLCNGDDRDGKYIFIPRTSVIYMGLEDVISQPDRRFKEIQI